MKKTITAAFILLLMSCHSSKNTHFTKGESNNLSEDELLAMLDLTYWRFHVPTKPLHSYDLEVLTYRDLEYTPTPSGEPNCLVSVHIPTAPVPVSNPNYKQSSLDVVYKVMADGSSKTQSVEIPTGPGVLRALYSEPKYYQTDRENIIVSGHFEYNMSSSGTKWEKKALLVLDLSYEAPIGD